MKAPAKIYAVSEPIRNLSSSNEDLIIYNWATTVTFSHGTEYIRRDVVGRAMWRLLADWKHYAHADTIDKYINEAIDNADED